MQLRYTQMLVGLRQAQKFMDANDDVMKNVNAGGARAGLNAVVKSVDELATRQEAHAIRSAGERASEADLADALMRDHVIPIVRVARASVPAVAQLDVVRSPIRRSNKADLVTRARALAQAVEPFTAELQAGGLSPAFVAELNAAADSLQTAINNKVEHRVAKIGATQGITDAVKGARRALGAVDALVRKTIPKPDTRLSEWHAIVQAARAAASRALKNSPQAPGTSTGTGTSPAPAVTPSAPAALAPVAKAA